MNPTLAQQKNMCANLIAKMLEYLLVSALMVGVSAPVAYKVRFLDGLGTLTACILGLAVGFTMGPVFLGVLIIFLTVNSLFTKMGYVKKALLGAAEPKGGARTWRSVVANGLSATIFAVLSILFYREILVVGFMSAIAAASADTASTEVGLLSGSKPRLITNLSSVEPGVSGGVTAIGLVGGAIGAISIGIIGLYIVHAIYGFLQLRLLASNDPFIPTSGITRYALAISVGGFCGTVLDSVLGATLQAKYVCGVCSKKTERAEHCGTKSTLIGGVKHLDNYTVNVLATFLGAIIGVLLFLA